MTEPGGGATPARRLFPPLDNTATVAGYPVTPKVAEIALEETAQRPYEQAMRHLGNTHGIHMGKELLENMTKTVGQWWLEEDRRVLAEARAVRTSPASEVSAERCLIFADGAMAHTEGAWHEVRVGTVRSELPDGAVVKSSTARRVDVETFGQDLWRNACRMGYRGASLTAFLGDGSHWLWNLADRHFQRAVKIVDFWHVCENVSKCAKVYFGEGSEQANRWSLSVCGTLRAGEAESALRMVEALNPRSSQSRRQAKHELVTYLSNNKDRMNYPHYESLGLPIGSGEVEAQCKTLVEARCKQSGMRWTDSGLEPLLRVRCAVRDGRYWREFGRWRGNLLAWQVRRKRLTA
ncbi:MAG: ISKra4 family transposase [Phycisphaerae bacterium]